MMTLIIFVILLIFILMGIPVAISMGLTAVICFTFLGQGAFLTMLSQRMFASTTGFTLLAVPFFILAGNLMNTGGITRRIFRFAKALVGNLPGGLGQVSVISNIIFSGMSGSALADAAGLGQVLHKAMVDSKIPPKFSASIVAAASTIGPIIPPSIPFVLYGALTNTSVSKLFLAGFIPGALMGLAMMIAIFFLAIVYKLPRQNRAKFKELIISFKDSFLPMMTPVIIIGGILSGIFTPTEASVVACIYSLLLGFFYKELKFKDLPRVFWETIIQTTNLLFIVAAAGFFGWLLIHQRIPDHLIMTLASLNVGKYAIMGILIIIILILGMFLEGNAIFIITLPLFVPIVTQYNIDLVQFGVVMTLLIMLGNLTPPVGMCLFAVAGFSKVDIGTLSKEVWPYLLGILIITIIIAYVPAISLYLPTLLMGK